MLHELPFEDLQTFFFHLISRTLDHLGGSSCQQWVLIHECIQPPPPKIPCQSSRPIQSPIDLVSFRQYNVSGNWISLTLHPNYRIHQVRLNFKRQNRVRSRALFIYFLPLSQFPHGNHSSGCVGETVIEDLQFHPISIFINCSIELIVAVMFWVPH